MATMKARLGRRVIPLLPVNRRTFDILRHEIRAFRRRTVNAISPGHHARVRALRGQRELQVNLGSGGQGLPGWVNVELERARDTTFCADIRQPLPLAHGSVARIFAEHVVEHVDFRHDLPRMLADWMRVLRPAGVARIVVPDAERFVAAYVSGDPGNWQALGWDIAHMPDDIHTPMQIVNHVFHQGGEHLFGYDFETLRWALSRAGFTEVHRSVFRQSVDPALAIDQDKHAAYSLYVDAVK
jgi:predicted SAM-dependent methyltransferase